MVVLTVPMVCWERNSQLFCGGCNFLQGDVIVVAESGKITWPQTTPPHPAHVTHWSLTGSSWLGRGSTGTCSAVNLAFLADGRRRALSGSNSAWAECVCTLFALPTKSEWTAYWLLQIWPTLRFQLISYILYSLWWCFNRLSLTSMQLNLYIYSFFNLLRDGVRKLAV